MGLLDRSGLFPLAIGLATATVSFAAQAQTAPATPAQAATPYAIAAQRNGITQCIPRINQITSFIIGNSPNSGMVFNSPNNEANAKLVSSVMEVQGTGNLVTFVTASFAPAMGSCGGTYDAVTYWPTNCSQLAASNFSTFKPERVLRQSITTLDGGPLVKVFLMPAGAGCISIKKEVLY